MATAVEPPLTVRPRRRHRVIFGVWVTIVVVVALGLILFLVLPTRTWLSQRSALSDTSHRLAVLQQENQAMQDRIKALQDPAEIERLAREQYAMVRPGEHPYAVTPGAPLTQLPAGWPYTMVAGILAARGVSVSQGTVPTTTPAATHTTAAKPAARPATTRPTTKHTATKRPTATAPPTTVHH